MFYRKLDLKKHKYFLKSINGLWILPVIIVNFVVPIFNFLIYKLSGNNAEIDAEKIIFFFFPISSVLTSIFVSEIFFSDKTKDVLFFYNNKRRFAISFVYFLLFSADTLIVTLLHFYIVGDYIGFCIKILSISAFYFGFSMLVLRFSKSAVITVMVLFLYALANTFVGNIRFFLFYENFEKLNFSDFLICYLPLIILSVIFLFVTFKSTNKLF